MASRGRAPRSEHRDRGRWRQRSAAPSAAPRNGPAQGVATKAASAPVAKLPAGCRPPPSTGSSNRPSRLAVIATASSSRSMIVRGSCSWNAQPASVPAARIEQKRNPERAGADHRSGDVRERVGPRLPRALARSGDVQRLQCQDREYAGHQVQQHPTGDCGEHRDEHRLPIELAKPAAAGTAPGVAVNCSPRPPFSASTPANCGRRTLRLQFRHQPVAGAVERLGCFIFRRIVGDRENVRVRDGDARRQRDRDAELAAGDLK